MEKGHWLRPYIAFLLGFQFLIENTGREKECLLFVYSWEGWGQTEETEHLQRLDSQGF